MTPAPIPRRAAAAVAALVLAAFVALPAGAAAPQQPKESCGYPAPVCAARADVFRVSSFDPFASAVLIAPGLLVTNRHVVADSPTATVHLAGGRVVEARVVPTSYAGDLVLLRADGVDGGPPPAIAAARPGADLYTVGADVGTGGVRVYPPGHLLLPPAPGMPLARLYHTAHGQPGNSGGALVDAAGHLVGIVASGGEGLEEAIPSARIATLRALSGPSHAAESRQRGADYRTCIETLEEARRGRSAPAESVLATIRKACTATGNRQLIDLTGQVFGRAGRLDDAIALFRSSLAIDPNALNARLSLAITLGFAGRYADQVPHIERLLAVLPGDLRVLRMAVQAGKWSGDKALVRRALALMKTHHPDEVPRARQFLDDNRPPPMPPR